MANVQFQYKRDTPRSAPDVGDMQLAPVLGHMQFLAIC